MLHLAVTKRARQIQKLLKVRKIDRLTSMLTFVKTVELESFIAAAAPLGCTPQAVAQLVRELEAHLGNCLLERTTRSQRLTPAGRAFLPHAKSILEQVQLTEALVDKYRQESIGDEISYQCKR